MVRTRKVQIGKRVVNINIARENVDEDENDDDNNDDNAAFFLQDRGKNCKRKRRREALGMDESISPTLPIDASRPSCLIVFADSICVFFLLILFSFFFSFVVFTLSPRKERKKKLRRRRRVVFLSLSLHRPDRSCWLILSCIQNHSSFEHCTLHRKSQIRPVSFSSFFTLQLIEFYLDQRNQLWSGMRNTLVCTCPNDMQRSFFYRIGDDEWISPCVSPDDHLKVLWWLVKFFFAVSFRRQRSK